MTLATTPPADNLPYGLGAESLYEFSDEPIKVLVVDDEQWHRDLQREILRAPRFAIQECGQGERALELIARNEFDAVLLDMRMPGLSGEEVCYRIRHELRKPFLPVLMVTASTARHDLERCMLAGATGFVRKPFDHVELITRLESAVRHKRFLDQLDSVNTALFALARMVEARDPGTGDHCSRLVEFCAAFGRRLDLPEHDLTALCRGAILHDIGKLAVPDRILLKEGPLESEEWQVMRTHPVVGAEVISSLVSLRDVVPIVRSHHERWDGSGYPDGLKGTQIPYLARVFQLADIFDALRNPRAYKPAYEMDKVIEILDDQVARGWLDPVLTGRLREHLAADAVQMGPHLAWSAPSDAEVSS